MNNDPIFFMKTTEPFGEFSNFYPVSFRYEGRTWASSEHCYQAMKFEDFHHQEHIRLQPNAFMAAKIGRSNFAPIRPNWDMRKDHFMDEITFCKFAQNENPKQLLLSTDDRLLVELSFKDNYWGSRPDMSGLNKLGHTLMRHRTFFRVMG